jgi:uncharacterized protein (DUF433 family)
MTKVVDLLERPVYELAEVDSLLTLRPGTARRWVDGYERRNKIYPPVVRIEPTGEQTVTWGEFVETRFLAEYRNKGVPMIRMRPAIERLRERFNTKYPLATAKPFAAGRELVLEIQNEVGLDPALRVIELARNGQLELTDPAELFWRSVDFDDDEEGIALRLHPLATNRVVVLDPLRQFGRPVVRSVPTEVIAEQFDAGDSVDLIARLYELPPGDVEAALRYEKARIKSVAPIAVA